MRFLTRTIPQGPRFAGVGILKHFSLKNDIMTIKVTKHIAKNKKETYIFAMFDLKAVFVGWVVKEKQEGKRSWEVVAFWDEYDTRSSNMAAHPPLTNDVKLMAKNAVLDLIEIKTWDEYKGK